VLVFFTVHGLYMYFKFIFQPAEGTVAVFLLYTACTKLADFSNHPQKPLWPPSHDHPPDT
jgi:hypothetical protein